MSSLEVSKIKDFTRIVAEQFSDDQAYMDLTTTALHVCNGRIALISLQDGDKMWFRTRVGLDVVQIPKEKSFCECAMTFCDRILVVEDAAEDPRFAGNPLVTGPLGIRFYVGAPLILSTGLILGNLCVLDTKPNKLLPEQLEMLDFLSKQVAVMLEKSQSHIRPVLA